MKNPFFNETVNEGNSLKSEKLKDAIQLFRKEGFLWLNNVFSENLVDELNKEIKKLISSTTNLEKDSWPTQKDNLRVQLTLEMEGIFLDSDIYGSSIIFQLLNQIFAINGIPNNEVKEAYKKIVVDSYTAIISLPKSEDQHIHSDGSGLFGSPIDKLLPTHALILGIPLVDLNEINGTTEIWLGSHMKDINSENSHKPYLKKGDCYLMDYRLFHRGMANNSKQKRAIIFIRYAFPWWRDVANFRRKVSTKNISRPMKINNKAYLKIPKKFRYLFRYAF